MALDNCPECVAGDLDFSNEAFLELTGDMTIGRAQIEWEFTDCSEFVTGPLKYIFKQSTVYWMGMTVANSVNGIATLEVTDANS